MVLHKHKLQINMVEKILNDNFSPLGSGGFGDVFLGKLRTTHAEVAVKRIVVS